MCSETTGEQLLEAVLQVRKVILDSKSHSFLAGLPTYDQFELDQAVSWSFSLNSEGSLLSKFFGNVNSTATTFIPFSFLLVPNYASEVYGENSICVEVNSTTLGDCLPLGGTPRCYQRRVVQQPTTNEVAFAINVGGKQNLFTRSKKKQTQQQL